MNKKLDFKLFLKVNMLKLKKKEKELEGCSL